jgi:CRP-like cAMP-binding protein
MLEIIDYVNKYITLTPEECDLITKMNKKVKYKKNDIIKGLSDNSMKSFFVVSGSVYVSMIIGDKESIYDFFFDLEPVIIPASGLRQESFSQIVSLSNCELLVSDGSQIEEIISNNSNFEKACRLLAEENLSKSRDFNFGLKNLSAQDKYLYIYNNRPELIERVPSFLLANYLGMSAETLSRIKKS